MIRTTLSIFCICLSGMMLPVEAQLGGKSTYAFLNLTNSARVASLGGKVASIMDEDLNLPFHNPSLLNPEMSHHLVVNYVNYFADINYGYASYAHQLEGIGTVAGGIHYINYGNFIAADKTGSITGKFKAAEYAFNLMYARAIDSNFSVGVNIKPVYSVLETYRSFGMVADVGLTYASTDRLFSTSIILRNMGTQLKPYYPGHRESMPFEILLGVSQKLRHAPFRFSIVAHNLQKPDLSYRNPNETEGEVDPITGEPLSANKWEQLGDNIMRHLIFGVEFTPFRNFYIRAGYNYQRRQELKLPSRTAMVGFSWGFGLRISRFHLSYGRASYHLAGASNHFSLATDISSFYKRRN